MNIIPVDSKHKIRSKNVVEEIDSVIDKLVKCFEARLDSAEASEKGVDINTDDIMMRHSTDLVFTCFYRQSNLIDYKLKKEPYSRLLDKGLNSGLHPAIQLACSMPIFRPILDWLIGFHLMGKGRNMIMEFMELQTKFHSRAKQQMAKAKQEGIAFDPDDFTLKDGTIFKRNMIDPFIDSYHDGKITKEEYLNSSFILFIAGTKTTADAISRMLYHLATHKDIQVKLRKAILKDGLESEYLGWCINESLRLEPPVAAGCSRRAEKDIEIEGGYVIPKGTLLMTPAHTIHKLPEYWGEDAEEYKPERWQDADKFHPLQFMAFGAGRRGCPGREFALFELRKVLFALLTRFRFDRCAKTSDLKLINSPCFAYAIFCVPTYLRVSRVSPEDDGLKI